MGWRGELHIWGSHHPKWPPVILTAWGSSPWGQSPPVNTSGLICVTDRIWQKWLPSLRYKQLCSFHHGLWDHSLWGKPGIMLCGHSALREAHTGRNWGLLPIPSLQPVSLGSELPWKWLQTPVKLSHECSLSWHLTLSYPIKSLLNAWSTETVR